MTGQVPDAARIAARHRRKGRPGRVAPRPGRARYGTKIRPLGMTPPSVVTAPILPVVMSIVPRELAGEPGAGQVDGALLALHGVTAVYKVPGMNVPVMASTVLEVASVVFSVPVAEVAQAMS